MKDKTLYVVEFEFRTDAGEWKKTDLSNNGEGFVYNEVVEVVKYLLTNTITAVRDLRIAERVR